MKQHRHHRDLADLGLALEPILLVARATVLEAYPLLDERPAWVDSWEDPANNPEHLADNILRELDRLRSALRLYRQITRTR